MRIKKEIESKKAYSTKLIALILILGLMIGILYFINLKNSAWKKDEKGIWIKKGNQLAAPHKVIQQQEAVKIALELYQNEKSIRVLSSQCLGTAYDYAVDLVHNPRSQEDNLHQNQCQSYLNGEVIKFIEIDADGNILRIQD